MKRALFLAFDMLPGAPVGAALRTTEFARWLPEFNWLPDVICARGGDPTGDSPEGVLQRIGAPLGFARSDQLTAWAWAWIVRGPARKLLQSRSHHLIYVSCPPFPHSLSGVSLMRAHGLPLVVDLRDSWSLDPHASGGALKRMLKSLLSSTVYRWSERWVFGAANAVITNTPSMRDAYAQHFGVDAERFDLIPNGFTEEDFASPFSPLSSGTPRVVHCGRFRGVGGRSPMLLLRCASQLRTAGREVELRIVGEDDPKMMAMARREGLADGLRVFPSVPHPAAITEIRRSNVVVIYQEPGRGQVTPVAGKTYEAIRSGRPILGLMPEGDNAELLRRYAGRAEVVTSFRIEDAVAALVRLLDGPQTDAPARGDFRERFERRFLGRKLAELFDRVVDEHAR